MDWHEDAARSLSSSGTSLRLEALPLGGYLKMSAAARSGSGCMVYVLPDPVCP